MYQIQEPTDQSNNFYLKIPNSYRFCFFSTTFLLTPSPFTSRLPPLTLKRRARKTTPMSTATPTASLEAKKRPTSRRVDERTPSFLTGDSDRPTSRVRQRRRRRHSPQLRCERLQLQQLQLRVTTTPSKAWLPNPPPHRYQSITVPEGISSP